MAMDSDSDSDGGANTGNAAAGKPKKDAAKDSGDEGDDEATELPTTTPARPTQLGTLRHRGGRTHTAAGSVASHSLSSGLAVPSAPARPSLKPPTVAPPITATAARAKVSKCNSELIIYTFGACLVVPLPSCCSLGGCPVGDALCAMVVVPVSDSEFMRAAQAAAVHPSMIVVDKLLTNTPLILQKKLNRAGGTFPLHSAQLVATAMCVVAAVHLAACPFRHQRLTWVCVVTRAGIASLT